MKQFVAIFVLSFLLIFPASAQDSSTMQGKQSLDMIAAETLDALIDTMGKFHFRINDVNRGYLYDTSVYLLFGNGSGYSNMMLLKLEEYSKYKPLVIKCENNGITTIYSYDGSNPRKWILTKKIKSRKRFNVAECPFVEFHHDTLEIVIRSSYLSWGDKIKKRGWLLAVSDWISCKFVYSEAEKRWLMIESDFGGI